VGWDESYLGRHHLLIYGRGISDGTHLHTWSGHIRILAGFLLLSSASFFACAFSSLERCQVCIRALYLPCIKMVERSLPLWVVAWNELNKVFVLVCIWKLVLCERGLIAFGLQLV
jgi:hypothetical protein